MWRWDQGRLKYFSIKNVRAIAAGLSELNGVELNQKPDPIRLVLGGVTGLPFAPDHYQVWRNYARVFKVLGLASKIDGRLVTTELCSRLLRTGEDFFSYDDYLGHLARTFYYPSPVFQGYNTENPQIFPFLAILKYLFASQGSDVSGLSVKEVFSKLIGNEVTGREPVETYCNLPATTLTPNGDQERQIREMLIFVSQLSYLSWFDGNLYLSPSALKPLKMSAVDDRLSALVRPRQLDAEQEVQNIGQVEEGITQLPMMEDDSNPADIVFTEGRKVRVSHLRTERNRKLIQFYFQNAEHPKLCDVCEVEVAGRYPWMDNLIEVHHVLPLASPLSVTREGTSLDDLVGVCPNCHRATHAFYRLFLRDHNLADFETHEQAREVYLAVKEAFVVA